MRKALLRAAQALMAAGALGLVRPAVAQTSPAAAKPPTGEMGAYTIVRNSPPSATHDAEAMTASEGKREEMQVELALLDSPSTFAYALAAKYTGANLELRGFVPSKFIKEQAVEIARKHCGVPVIDKVQVNDAMMLRTGAGSADELRQGAAALLAENAGATTGLEIKASGEGLITLDGSCESYEQKLEISKKLRGLNGCCAVDNRLNVKPVQRAGRMVTLVSADGSFSLPTNDGSDTLTHAPTHAAYNLLADSAWTEPPPVPPPTVAVTPPKVTKMDLPPAPITTKIETQPLPPVKADPPPTVAVTPPKVTKMDLPPAPITTKIETHLLPPIKADPAPTVPAPTVAIKCDLPPLPPASSEWSQGVSSQIVPPPSKPVAPSIAQTNATFASTSSPSASRFANVPAYAKAPTSAAEQTPAPASVEHLPPPPTVVKPVPPASGVWPSAHDAHSVQVAYATTGVVVFGDEPLPEPPPLLVKDNAALLKQKVAAVCGAKAKNVIVETKADGVHVHVQSVGLSENEALTREILGLPEMATQNVKLHIELAQ